MEFKENQHNKRTTSKQHALKKKLCDLSLYPNYNKRLKASKCCWKQWKEGQSKPQGRDSQCKHRSRNTCQQGKPQQMTKDPQQKSLTTIPAWRNKQDHIGQSMNHGQSQVIHHRQRAPLNDQKQLRQTQHEHRSTTPIKTNYNPSNHNTSWRLHQDARSWAVCTERTTITKSTSCFSLATPKQRL